MVAPTWLTNALKKNEKMDPTSDDLERAAVCSKKSSKGPFWQSRFFRTRMNHLQYWSNKEAFTKDPWMPSSDFDICDFKVIEYEVGRYLHLTKGDKYGLHLQFGTEIECREWYETLLAKRALYSVQELMVDLRGANKCVTQTFAHMLVLGETEQSRWISEHIEEQFAVASRTNCGGGGGERKSDEIVSISAARRCLEEFLHTCQDCATEMRQRNPKIMAHCRRYMHTYERLLTGRLILQLSCMVPASQANKRPAGPNQKQKRKLSELGERVLCASIGFMERLEAAKSFVFLNQDTYRSVTETIFTMGELLSALLDLSIERVESWFSSVHSLPLTQRAGRMAELKPVLLEMLVESYLEIIAAHDSELQSSLYTRVITSTLLTFHDQLAAVEFGEYSTDALVAHINACQTISEMFSSGTLTWAVPSPRPVSTNTVYSPAPALTQGVSSKSAKHVSMKAPSMSSQSLSSPAAAAALDEVMYEISIPTAVLDSLRDICFLSARAASVELVCSVGRASSPMLLDCLIVSSDNKGWIGGAACRLLVDHFRDWTACIIAQIPERFGRIVSSEVGRLIVRLYMHTVIKRYTGDKRLKLDDAGVAQMESDLASLEAWIRANVSAERPGSQLQTEELHLIASMCQFMRAPKDALLDAFAQAVLNFGSAQGLQVYDLLRLALKIRLDLSTKLRKNILGMATEFLHMLMQTLSSDPDLMLGAVLGRTSRQVRVLDELCPRAGAEHCTGKKWSLETLPDPTVARFIISQVIARVCTAARKLREERQREEREDKVCRVAVRVSTTARGASPTADAASETREESTPAPLPAPLLEESRLLPAVRGLEAGLVEAKEGEGEAVDPVLFDELDALNISEAAASDEEKEAAPVDKGTNAAPGSKGLRVFGGGGKAAEVTSKPSLVPVPIPADRDLRHVAGRGVAGSASASRRVPPPPPPPLPPAASAPNPFDGEDEDSPPSSALPSKAAAEAEEGSREESLRPLPVAVLVSGAGLVKAPPPKPTRPSLPGSVPLALTPSLLPAVAPPRVSGVAAVPSVAVESTPVPRPSPFSVPTEPVPSTYAPLDRSRGVAGSAAADEANRQAALRRQSSSIQDRLKNA